RLILSRRRPARHPSPRSTARRVHPPKKRRGARGTPSMRGRGFRRRSLGLVAILLGLTAGCGDGSSPSTAGTPDDNLVLQSFAEDYRMYSISKKHPPRKADDMKVMQSMAMPTAEAIRNGDIIVLWGAELPDLKEEPG